MCGLVATHRSWGGSPSSTARNQCTQPLAVEQLEPGPFRDLKDRGLNARGEVVRVLEGLMSRGIVESAENASADVIVMGTRGLSNFGGLILGSVTNRVLHLAEKPVVVVP